RISWDDDDDVLDVSLDSKFKRR
ncbi:hypothetical protein Tco_1542637, partial [Tanacetum coccineum]